MERYRVLNRIGKGAQGFVYLALNKAEGQQYILKQVECNDESECNKAFKESLTLGELKHPYICTYKEFFVTWDKELSAMFVSVVSDYYERGDLAKFLKEKRENSEAVDEELIKKWLGQILEAFIYIHKKRFVHRDLKPSNIYISSDDNSLAIGDFGVPTVMADIRTKTRGSLGSMNWMAPEVLEQAYDDKSDLWAVGCVMAELASCQCYTAGEIGGKLYEIKHNDEALDSLLEDIGKTYSEEFIAVLRQMLDRKHGSRPTPTQLVEGNFYLKQCLAISNSVIVERKRRAMSASSTSSPTGSEMVPKNRGPVPVIDYLLDNLINESCVKQAMEYLVEITKEENATLDKNAKRVVAKAMKDYVQEWDVQVWGMNVFNNVVPTAQSTDLMYTSDVISVVPAAMKFHPERAEVQEAAAQLLVPIAAQESASQVIGDLGGVGDVINAMSQFPDHVSVQTACCNALWSLTVNEDNMRIVTEAQGVRQVICALKTHKYTPELVEAASASLVSLSMEDMNLDLMNKGNIVATLLETLDLHQREAKVVKNVCMALAATVEPDEECAYKLLTNVRDDGTEEPGLPYICTVYELHKDNAEVVENIATLLMELCEYDEICAEVKHLKMGESILHEIHRRFKENKSVMIPCEQALVKLGSKIRLQHPSAKKKA